jgi:hypothetical protein
MSSGEKYQVRSRLLTHEKSKSGLWTHFSVYEVWDNITKAQVVELEGLFRHVYREDKTGKSLNIQKKSTLIAGIQRQPEKWIRTIDPNGSKLSSKNLSQTRRVTKGRASAGSH